MKILKSLFTFLLVSAIPVLTFTSCGGDEPGEENSWSVKINGQIHTYPIVSAAVYYAQNGGCSLLFVDKEFSVTKPLHQEPPSNWCTIDIPLGDWDFYLATSDCRPDSYYTADELSQKKQSFSGPSSKGEYTLKFTCHIPADNIDISINYKGIPQPVDYYFWQWNTD